MNESLSRDIKARSLRIGKFVWAELQASLRTLAVGSLYTLLAVSFLFWLGLAALAWESSAPLEDVVSNVIFYALLLGIAITQALPFAPVGGLLTVAFRFGGWWTILPVFLIPICLAIVFWLGHGWLAEAGVTFARAFASEADKRATMHIDGGGGFLALLVLSILVAEAISILVTPSVLCPFALLLLKFFVLLTLALVPSGVASMGIVGASAITRAIRRYRDFKARALPA